ncbi:MAG: prepilin-type N-terminal cleavage/methylation domain-containing protein [Acidobacteria bacterium]|nr:prepilin-type N-terminal cleavage/methylation domain-containing protein [Acidobacteriota bacterium]
MPISSVGRNSARRGITLLELVVVVAIVGLIVGVSFPAVSAGLDSVRMISATDSVAAFLNSAVNHCERRQEPVEVVIDLRRARLTAISMGPGYNRELQLPDGIAIESVSSGDAGASAEAEHQILLMPGGAVPGVGIQFVTRRGFRRIVRLDPMTGYPRVESVKPS